jgi:hypothetical protein
VGVVFERMRSGCSATSSFANRRIDCASSGAAQRVSIWVLRPSVHPSFWSPSRNAATKVCPSRSLSANAISRPIRRIWSVCARAESAYAYGDKHFDLVISLDFLNNLRIFDLETALRVCKQKCVMVESYRTIRNAIACGKSL